MDVKTIPPMKPVLVTKISDDINVLQKDDVTKQSTVLTARAIEDAYKCAPFSASNEADVPYYDASLVDLDKVTTAQSRTLAANKYKNGPLIAADKITGNATWAANHSPKIIVPDAFIYVFSILDTNALEWDNYDGIISMEDKASHSADVAYRKVKDREPSHFVRQIFVVNHLNEYLSQDGTKDPTDQEYRNKHRSRYNIGQVWTRIGRYDETNNTYVWEDWYVQGKTHEGPEYFQNIVVKNNFAIEKPLVDAVYHIYGTGTMVLPNANWDGYKVGQKIIVEVHPPLAGATETPRCQITYTDTTNVGVSVDSLSLLVTPRIRRNTKDVYGNIREDSLITGVACLELVEVDYGNEKRRTWELDAGVEESDFTAGLAQQLGEHTDRVAWDIVNAQSSIWNTLKAIDVIFPVTNSGYVIADFFKKQSVSGTWTASVAVVTPTRDPELELVAASGTPDPNLTYYIRESDKWRLAENGGHPTAFAGGNEYYSLNYTNTEAAYVTKHSISETATSDVVSVTELTEGVKRRFALYAPRGSIIKVHIESNVTMNNFVGKLYPIVGFYPDPHDSYLHKVSVNPKAFTLQQLKQLFDDGSITGDIRLFLGDEAFKGVLNGPIASRALINAYAYLAGRLQAKGLLFGNVYTGTPIGDDYGNNVSSTYIGLKAIYQPGCHFIMPNRITTPNEFPPDMDVTGGVPHGFNLIVITDGHAPAGVIHEDESNDIVEANHAMQIAVILTETNTYDGLPPTFKINTRLGTKTNGNWTWGPWTALNDWSVIRNIPLFFRGRWDYFLDPNGIISFVDQNANKTDGAGGNICIMRNTVDGSVGERECVIQQDYIAGLMAAHVETADAETDVRRTNKCNYRIPTLMVGIRQLDGANATSWAAAVSEKKYVATIQLPDAVATADVDVNKRRKIRIMFYGIPDSALRSLNWDDLVLRVKYKSIFNDPNVPYDPDDPSLPVVKQEYSYERTWGTNDPTGVGPTSFYDSMIVVDFEQVDLPTGERVWSPIEVG